MEELIAKPIFSDNRLAMVDFLDRNEKQRITEKPMFSPAIE
jgi:hypothetical protein